MTHDVVTCTTRCQRVIASFLCIVTVARTPADDCVSAADDDYIYSDIDDDGGLISTTPAWRPTSSPSHEYSNSRNNRSADLNIIKSSRPGNGRTVA